MRFRRDALPIGEIVDGVLKQARSGTAADERARLEEAWRKISDQVLLRHTRVGSWNRGVLVLEVKSPPLCSQLASFRSRRLLEDLRRELKEEIQVRELRFVLAEI
jgi:hypothetical protein